MIKGDKIMKNEIQDLSGILQQCFGCKRPFRSTPICIGEELDGNKKYDTVTKAGWKAYEKLTDCIYALETIGAIESGNDVIEILDDIISENGAYYTEPLIVRL